jgi:hypothetical protein
MNLDRDRFSDREDLEDAVAVLHNRRARAQGAQPIAHEDAKRLLREAAAKAAASSTT